MFNLDSKVVVITGAGSGIGQAIATLFAKQGASIHILDINESGARKTIQNIQANGGAAFHYNCNVSHQQQTVDVFKAIIKTAGRIDILVNSAGISHIGTLETTSEADFDKIYQVNIKGVYNTMFAVIGAMKEEGKGVILNIASVAAARGIAERFAYAMSKGAVATMTLSVAKDYINHNIRCNSIAPARIHTPFVDSFLKSNYPGREKEIFDKLSKTQPIGRMGTPEEVATLALYLCSDEAAFITGCDYPVDGGFLTLNT